MWSKGIWGGQHPCPLESSRYSSEQTYCVNHIHSVCINAYAIFQVYFSRTIRIFRADNYFRHSLGKPKQCFGLLCKYLVCKAELLVLKRILITLRLVKQYYASHDLAQKWSPAIKTKTNNPVPPERQSYVQFRVRTNILLHTYLDHSNVHRCSWL